MRFLRSLFGWLTLVSLMVWAGVAAYIVLVQYRDVPPVGWPRDYAGCVVQWSAREPDAAKAAAVAARCADYYALLGSADAPLLARLKQQVQGRLTDSVIEAYLRIHRPLPGEVITGPDVLAALGSATLVRLTYETVTKAADPPSVIRRAQLRCMLEETRRLPAGTPPLDITQSCSRR